MFKKDQRVSHAAIVENKRLRHALKIVKAQQDLKLGIKVMTNSGKTLYKKRPRQVFEPDFDRKSTRPAAAEMMEIACNRDFTHSDRTTTTDISNKQLHNSVVSSGRYRSSVLLDAIMR